MTKVKLNIEQSYKMFPGRCNCIDVLEEIIWDGVPRCPYCKSVNPTPVKEEHRYHCNVCFTSFSVTVGTVFHNTKVDLQKWFVAIDIFYNQKIVSCRELAYKLSVTKDTARRMMKNIKINRTEPYLNTISNKINNVKYE